MTILWNSLRDPGVKILPKVLCEYLVEILVKCCQRPLHDLAQVLVRSYWRGPGEILSVSLHDLVHVLVRRLCGDPVEILLKRSLRLRSCRFSALVLVSKYFWDAHRKFLYEALVTSPIDLHRRSCWCSCDNVYLICCCSRATFCLCLVHGLPTPTLLHRSLAGVLFCKGERVAAWSG